MKPALYLLALLTPFLSMCQPPSVKGKVISQDGEPVPAATITIHSNHKSTITSSNGEFTIQLPAYPATDSRLMANDSLTISAIGYETQTMSIAVALGLSKGESNTLTITITLTRKSTTLSAVTLSTGYQELNKERATGSFDKIENNLLSRVVAPDILSRLEGIAQGTLFTKNFASKGIFIRGISTLRADGTEPLIILDNFPYEGDINNINPNDVENITILRDAAAASIWGARAGNGVIVITTKKAGYNQPPSLAFTYNVTAQQQTDLLKDRNFIESPDFIELERFLFNQGFYNGALNNTTSRPVVSPVVEILARQRAGFLSAAQADSLIEPYKNKDIRKHMADYLRRSQFRSQYALSLTGGSTLLNYQLNLGYDRSVTEIRGNENDRITLYSLVGIRPLKNLEIQTGINYTHRKTISNGIESLTPGGGKSVYFPYAQLTDENGNSLPLTKDYRMGFIDTAGAGRLLDWKYRPLDELHFADNNTIEKALLLKLNIKYNFLRRFSFIVNAQITEDNRQQRSHRSIETYSTRNLVNRYTQINGATVKNNIPPGGILDNTNDRSSGYAFRSQLNYDAVWSAKYRLTAIAGFEAREQQVRSASGRTYGYDDNILTFSQVDYTTAHQLYGNFGTATVPVFQGFDETISRFVSLYTNAAFTLHNRYTFSASARKDASNLFGVNTNQKWTPLWSAGAAWKISDEKFYTLKGLSSLRLRFTYGFSGNVDNTIPSQPIIGYRSPVSPTFIRFATVLGAWNPDLRWEKVRTINLGLDFSFRRQRVSGSLEYYTKYATDLLASAPVDPTLGISGNIVTMNVAHLAGRGLDLKLNTKMIDRAVKLEATILFSYSTNKVTEYLLESVNKGSRAGYGYGVTPIKGKDPYALISFKWRGLDPQTGDPVGIVNDTISKNYFAIANTTSWNDMVIGGSTRPPFFGSFMPAATWKGFTLSANIIYRLGYYFRRNTVSYSSLFNSWAGHADYYKRWKQPGDEQFTTVPSLTYPANASRDQFYQYSEATVERGDHIRLHDIRLAWSADKIKIGKASLRNLQLYTYISNVGIIWSATRSGLDPDYGNSLPPRPAYALGAKLIL